MRDYPFGLGAKITILTAMLHNTKKIVDLSGLFGIILQLWDNVKVREEVRACNMAEV
jgi:hypothetical protein